MGQMILSIDNLIRIGWLARQIWPGLTVGCAIHVLPPDVIREVIIMVASPTGGYPSYDLHEARVHLSRFVLPVPPVTEVFLGANEEHNILVVMPVMMK